MADRCPSGMVRQPSDRISGRRLANSVFISKSRPHLQKFDAIKRVHVESNDRVKVEPTADSSTKQADIEAGGRRNVKSGALLIGRLWVAFLSSRVGWRVFLIYRMLKEEEEEEEEEASYGSPAVVAVRPSYRCVGGDGCHPSALLRLITGMPACPQVMQDVDEGSTHGTATGAS
nr:hypothetical protein CFP56_33591 [Quercus suber]